MNPSEFGPHYWFVIHTTAINANTPEKREAFKMLIYSLAYCFLCDICGKHLKENLSNINIDDYMTCQKSIFEFSVDLHNIVNKQLGKPILSMQQAQQIWGHKKAKCPVSFSSNQSFSFK
jgi:hypothetical protein